MSKLSIDEIVKLVDGDLIGSCDTLIRSANTLEYASRGEISFLENPKYKKWLGKTNASCVLVSKSFKDPVSVAIIKVDDTTESFRKVLNALYGEKEHPVKGISDSAEISAGVSLGQDVAIGDFTKIEDGAKIGDVTIIYPGVYVGKDVEIGKNCILYPKTIIMERVKIGDNVIIHSGSVIGSDGFGYITKDGRHTKMPQAGSVVIENNVEIGSNVSIDRGSPGNTVIGGGTKIDNLVQIAHNVRIGKNCFIISQVGISGSTIIEDDVILAGQAGLVGHITIGRGTKVGAQAGVTHNIKPDQMVSGYPAMDHRSAQKINALIRKLPELFKQVKELRVNKR